MTKPINLLDRLVEDIRSGEIPAGELIPEAKLAARYGVSRTPVREALGKLELRGLIVRKRGGIMISEPSASEILEIYDLRILLEAEAARLAAVNRSDLDLSRLNALCDAMDDADDLSQIVELNYKFHGVLCEASRNRILGEFLERLNADLARFGSSTLSEQGRKIVAIQQHRELFEAVRDRDAKRAQEIMAKHLTEARAIRLEEYGRRYGTSG